MEPPEVRSQIKATGFERWTSAKDATTEEATFLRSGAGSILAILHSPADGTLARAVVVICGSLFEDLHVNYRTELLLARVLARRGCAVARFHYRGTGNSDDLSEGAVTFGSMSADLRSAVTWAQGRWDRATPLILCGFRAGALLASNLAEPLGADLICWAPVVDGHEYFRRLSRASRVARVRRAAHSPAAAAGGERDLREGSPVELLAHTVDPRTYADLRDRALPDQIGRRDVLVLQVGTGSTGSRQIDRTTARWRAAGARVTEKAVSARQQWFVPDRWEPEDSRPETTFIIDAISEWVAP